MPSSRLLCTAYQVKARITECKKFKGIRGLFYIEAEKHFSYCVSGTHEQCITYDHDDLVLCLGFKQEEQALRMQFLLRSMNRGDIVRSLARRVTDIHLTTISTTILSELITQDDYEAAAYESPAATLDDAAGADASSVSSSHTLALDSDVAKYQSIEKRIVLVAAGVDQAHIWPQRCCTPAQKQDPNNMLGLSKNLHNMFDGPHGGQHGVPRIAIRPLQQPVPSVVHGTRQVVHIAVQCQDAEAFSYVQANLKDGTSVANGPDGREFHTWIEVQDAQTCTGYLQKTYDHTIEQWRV